MPNGPYTVQTTDPAVNYLVMRLGIKEPKASPNAHVPGTSVLFENSTGNHAATKHAAGKESDLILVPQPSNSPNDPLVYLVTLLALQKAYVIRRIGLCGKRI